MFDLLKSIVRHASAFGIDRPTVVSLSGRPGDAMLLGLGGASHLLRRTLGQDGEAIASAIAERDPLSEMEGAAIGPAVGWYVRCGDGEATLWAVRPDGSVESLDLPLCGAV